MATKKKTKKKTSNPKKSAKRKVTPAKAARNKLSRNSTKKQKPKRKSQRSGTSDILRERRGQRSRAQSGDLQGLSRRESADSQSVDELLEEGNAFEADAVLGVEDADRADGKEVRTHEVPEDDVPEE